MEVKNIKLNRDERITLKKSLNTYWKKHQRKNSDVDDEVKRRKAYELILKLEALDADEITAQTEYNSMDYFIELNNWMYNECVDENNTFPRAYTQFRHDLFAYREASIKQYNDNIARGTDAFCMKNFLNQYKTAIMVFNLHSEIKNDLLALINIAWEFMHTRKKDRV